jgi:hypothetical protein
MEKLLNIKNEYEINYFRLSFSYTYKIFLSKFSITGNKKYFFLIYCGEGVQNQLLK